MNFYVYCNVRNPMILLDISRTMRPMLKRNEGQTFRIFACLKNFSISEPKCSNLVHGETFLGKWNSFHSQVVQRVLENFSKIFRTLIFREYLHKSTRTRSVCGTYTAFFLIEISCSRGRQPFFGNSRTREFSRSWNSARVLPLFCRQVSYESLLSRACASHRSVFRDDSRP